MVISQRWEIASDILVSREHWNFQQIHQHCGTFPQDRRVFLNISRDPGNLACDDLLFRDFVKKFLGSTFQGSKSVMPEGGGGLPLLPII